MNNELDTLIAELRKVQGTVWDNEIETALIQTLQRALDALEAIRAQRDDYVKDVHKSGFLIRRSFENDINRLDAEIARILKSFI